MLSLSHRRMANPNPFRYFKTSPEIIRLAVMLYVRFPLSLRNVEDLLHERGIDVSQQNRTVLVEQIWSDVRSRDPPEAEVNRIRLPPASIGSHHSD